MSTIQSILAAGPPIDQQTLTGLSKGSLRQYLHGQSGASVPDDIETLWHCLVSSALSPDSSEKYLTTACNCISVFLLGAASSPVSGVKKFVTSGKVWFEGFDCAQQAFDGGKTKPALQVLETLAQLLREHPDNAAASVILQQSSRRLLKILFTGTPSGQIKSVCIALTCLVKRTGLLTVLEDELADCLDQGSSSRPLFLALLFAVRNLETRSAALKLFTFLLHSEGWTRGCRSAQSAAEVIELFLLNDTPSLGNFADNIIPVILDTETRYEVFRDLYKPDKAGSESRLILYLSVLKAGRLRNFLSDGDLPAEVNEGLGNSPTQSQDLEDRYASFRLLLRAASPSVRVHAYNSLTANFGTIAAIPVGVLRCLLGSLRYLHKDNDAHERGEVISITRRLLRRLKSSRVHLQKKQPRSIQDEDTLCHYDDFLRQLGNFLLLEMDPGVSYQRHVLALHTLQLLLQVARDPWLDSHSLAHSLSNLILDTFDDVRSLAAILLKDLIELTFDGVTPSFVMELSWRVQRLSARTCRHDHADAAGRLRAIVISQEGIAAEAQASLFDRLHECTTTTVNLTPASGFALHATLLGLAYGLDAERNAMEDIWPSLVEICEKIWIMVQPQLCVDSPEKAADDTEEDGGPKDLLAYSWRALRDSSLLLQSILRLSHDGGQVLAQIGWLCMDQLTLLRHRGAFSTVAQTFNLCCEQRRTSQDPSTQQLNDAWYKAARCEIDKQSTKLTRRSAGLPAMICAVLDPSDSRTFGDMYLDLKGIASRSVITREGHYNNTPLPQVHALNCLKDIMTHAKFRSSSARYLDDALELAANSLSSSVWAIRNCGLMLLRACVTRVAQRDSESPANDLRVINGEDTGMSPPKVAKSLLHPKTNQLSNPTFRSENIFAGLDLAKHMRLAYSDNRTLTQLIYLQLGSAVWAIRDHAARVLAARIVLQRGASNILPLFSLPSNCTENLLHGTMLLHGYVSEGFRQDGEEATSLAWSQWLTSIVATRIKTGCSPYAAAAFLDVVNSFILHDLKTGSTGHCTEDTLKVFECSRMHIQRNETLNLYCQARLLLNETLSLQLRCQHYPDRHQTVNNRLISALVQHPDAARFILEQLGGLPSTPGLVDLLIELVISTQATEVRALAMMRVASCMESGCNELSGIQSISLTSILDDLSSYDRNLWEACIRLEACLIKMQLAQKSGGISNQLVSKLRLWLYRLTVASRDQLELSTRINAAAALRHCGTDVAIQLDEMRTKDTDEHMINVLLVVYDQLNDDDEEIRKMAEHTASEILQALGQVRGLSIPTCALAAREALLGYLVDRFDSGPELAKVALARLVGESGGEIPELRLSFRSMFRESVSDKLSRIRASMNDLFAEEKQNLYIDDLDEEEKWSNVLRQCRLTQLDPEWPSEAVEWCSEGLDVLTTLLRSGTSQHVDSNGDQNSLHPLGHTYHPGGLVLSLRVVALAKILTHAEPSSEESSIVEFERSDREAELRQKMREFRDTVTKLGAHRRVLEATAITPSSGKE